MQNKVLSASAGTGKTHRLASEFIAILIKNMDNPDFHFEKILVITFTRKATAEIRQKIFTMLDELVIRRTPSIIKQIENLVGHPITGPILDQLYRQYVNIRTQKEKVRISTIDSLITNIFRNMIAPIMKFADYHIDENANHDIWKELFEHLTSKNQLSILQRLMSKNAEKNLEKFGATLTKLIENRWVYHFIKKDNISYKSAYHGYIDSLAGELYIMEKEQATAELRHIFREHAIKVVAQIDLKKKSAIIDDFIDTNAKVLLRLGESMTSDIFLEKVDAFLSSGIFSLNKASITKLLNPQVLKLYNGGKLRKNPLSDVSLLKKALLRFVYYHYALPELSDLYTLWESILIRYDEIKSHTRTLTYTDVTWYTYAHLHDPEYSLIDEQTMSVTNQFYEFLTVKNQYLLIDEFQDTSLMQYLILAPMLSELMSGQSVYQDTAVIVVGDEKQSIYGWRGGEKELLRHMSSVLDAPISDMKTNYRSVPEVMSFVNDIFSKASEIDLSADEDDDESATDIEENESDANEIIPSSHETWVYPENLTSARINDHGTVKNHFFIKERGDHSKPEAIFVDDIVIPHIQKHSLRDTAIIARRTIELENIAKLLSAQNIPYLLESSLSIFEHNIIKAILHLLRYISYSDHLSLLKFLRSDIVLIDCHELKSIATLLSHLPSDEQIVCTTKAIEIVSHIKELYSLHRQIDSLYQNPLTLCVDIIERFDIQNKFTNDFDVQNLQYFLSIIAEFLGNPIDYIPDLHGFISFADKSREKVTHRLKLTPDHEALYLTTIHKSKGLGFHSTLVYVDTTNVFNNFTFEVEFFVCRKTFSKLSDVYVSMSYRKIVTELFQNDYQKVIQKRSSEELNNLYVAFTRAEVNLEIFWIQKQTKSSKNNAKAKITVKEQIAEIARSSAFSTMIALPLIISAKHTASSPLARVAPSCVTIRARCTQSVGTRSGGCVDVKGKCYIQSQMPPCPLSSNNSTGMPIVAVAPQSAILCLDPDFFDIKNLSLKLISTPHDDSQIHMKTVFLKQKSQLYGNAIHHYLSCIKYDTTPEHELALWQTTSAYGNILSTAQIAEVAHRAKHFVTNNRAFYSTCWDKVFNEITITDRGYKTHRIDRLMISTAKKEVLIIDYKTGHEIASDNMGQIDRYIDIVSELPIYKKGGYTIRGEYCQV
jgi:ATP-dependent exoDNAse (exonuclease V) beta subunit